MTEIAIPASGNGYAVITPGKNRSLRSVESSFIEDAYKTRGALLFRGFDLNVESFKEITSRFCIGSAFNEAYGRMFIDRENNIQSVDIGNDEFPLHPEISREPWKPDVCWFACIRPPSSGGETTLCDGIAVVKELPDETRKALSTRRLLYIRLTTDRELLFWLGTENPEDEQLDNPPATCPFGFRREGGKIYRYFTVPALHQPMFSSQPAFGNFLLFARYKFNNDMYPLFADGTKIPSELVQSINDTCNSIKIEHTWQINDLLMLDNTRYMHGRNEVVDTDERLIATYFGYLRFSVPGAEEPADAIWRNAAGLDDMGKHLRSE